MTISMHIHRSRILFDEWFSMPRRQGFNFYNATTIL